MDVSHSKFRDGTFHTPNSGMGRFALQIPGWGVSHSKFRDGVFRTPNSGMGRFALQIPGWCVSHSKFRDGTFHTPNSGMVALDLQGLIFRDDSKVGLQIPGGKFSGQQGCHTPNSGMRRFSHSRFRDGETGAVCTVGRTKWRGGERVCRLACCWFFEEYL